MGMTVKHQNRFTRFLLVALLVLTTVLSAVPVLANGNITSDAYWKDIAGQLATANGGFADADELAQQLSGVAGNNTVTDTGGVKHPTVYVGAGGNKYYVGGRVLDTQPQSTYTTLTINGIASKDNAPLTVTVHVYTDAESEDLGRVQANVSTGLLSQSDVNPDTGTAMNLLSGVIPVVNTFLGLIVVVISVGMTVFSALDIVYLAFPAFSSYINNQVESGGKGTKQNKEGGTTSKWVTEDAIFALKTANSNGVQPWGMYFKRRVLAYIFLATILFVLLTGNIFSITTLVTNMLQGLFDSLGIG